MADFKRMIQRITNSERIESKVAQVEPHEIVISTDTEELFYKNSAGEFISVSKDRNTFDTIEDLQKSKKLKLGEVVSLDGYYSKGDGAHHKRKIEASDDGSGVQLPNGLWANIVHSGEVNVSWFGMNEKIDFYLSLKKIANAVSTNDSITTLIFNTVNYFTEKYIINRNTDWSVKNDISHIRFDVRDRVFNIEGCGCCLNYIGVFERFYEFDIGQHKGYSSRGNFGIFVVGSKDSSIRDFNIDGGAGTHVTMRENTYNSVSSYPTEGASQHHSIVIEGCLNLSVENCSFSKATDGVYLTGTTMKNGDKVYSKNIFFKNCKFIKNTRQGVSAVGYKNVYFSNCLFEKTAKVPNYKDGISEGGHSPGAGVDFEQEFISETDEFGGFTIENCVFENNGTVFVNPSDKNGSFVNNRVNGGRTWGTKLMSGNVFHNSEITTTYGSSYNSLPVLFFEGNLVTFDDNFSAVPTTPVTFLAADKLYVENNIFQVNLSEEYTDQLTGDGFWFYRLDGNFARIKNNVFGTSSLRTGKSNGYFLYATFSYTAGSKCYDLEISDNYFYKDIPEGYTKNTVSYFNIAIYTSKKETDTKEKRIKIFNNSTNTRILGNANNILYDVDTNGKQGAIIGTNENVPKNAMIGSTFYNKSSNKFVILKNRSTNGDIVTNEWVDVSGTMATQLDTPYYMTKMQSEGIYEEYITYRDELFEYEQEQKAIEQQRQEAYQLALEENPELSYEDWLSAQPMTLSISEEPQPSERLVEFKEKWLGK